MKKIYTILLTLSVCSICFPQISEITRLPYQNKDIAYTESSPVVISDNEILIFFCTTNSKTLDYFAKENDTLYYCRSTNGGVNWDSPNFVTEIGKLVYYSQNWYLTSLLTSSGRTILAWSDWKNGNITSIFSDDNGLTWSDKSVITSLHRNYLNLSEIDSGRVILSYVDLLNKTAYFKESFDDGDTWSPNTKTFMLSSKTIRYLSFINLGERILGFFEYDNSGIYYKESTNNGLTWSAEIPVLDSPARLNNPRVIKQSDEWLQVVYQLEDTTISNNQNDIYSLNSYDSGETWNIPDRFSRYTGEDQFVRAAKIGEKTFITFSSTRFNNRLQICYGVIGETVEKYRPPYIKNVYATSDSLKRKEWLVTALVFDDEKVVLAKVSFDDGTSAELFDDGKHNDGDSLDNIFANTILFNSLPPSNESYIDVNKMKLPINNRGILAGIRTSYKQNALFEASDNAGDKCSFNTYLENTLFVGATYDEGTYLFSGGFFLSGYTDGVLWSNAAASASLVEDYLPGIVGGDKDDPVNKVYVIYEDDSPFGYSWQRWKDAVSLGAEFYDGDKDGVYNPVDRNFNGTWELNEDMPLLLGDVTAWCVYNDGLPKEQRRWDTVDPLGIEIKQTVFASSLPELENVIFIKYSVLNTGSIANELDSVYFGIWEDGDLGDFTDDVVGCDTILQSGFYYNNDTDYVYGNNQPSFFTSLLQGPIVNTNVPEDTAQNYFGELNGIERMPYAKNLQMNSHMFFIGGDPDLRDPNNAVEARCYLEGKTRTCQYLNPCTFAYGEVRGGIDCNLVDKRFSFSGDPVKDIGWICTQNRDMRNLVSTGPFLLEKDKPQEIIIAYVIGRGSDPLNSVTVARENVQRAIEEYESNFATMTYTPPPATNPVNSYVLYQNYPNPFNPTTTIRYELPQDGVVTIEVFDILGQKVKTILNEFKKADRYEVTFNAKGLASGVYIYRLKVNDFITSKKMVLIK